MHLEKLSYKKTQLVILFLLWAFIQSLLYLKVGIQPILESEKYINAAESLLNTGKLPGVRYLFYLNTTLIITFCLKTGLGYAGVVGIQLIINLIALAFFFVTLFKKQRTAYNAFITTLVLLITIPFFIWNFYLYTESVFYSLSLIFFTTCIRNTSITLKVLLVQLFILVLVITSRPLGILFLPCWIVYLCLHTSGIKRKIIIASSIIGLLVSIYISNLILRSINGWQVLLPAEYGYIICDIPSEHRLSLNNLKDKQPLTQLFSYISEHPSHFFKLTLLRIKSFFVFTRPYYSILHNSYIIIICLILYIPIIINLFRHSNFLKHKDIVIATSIVVVYSVAISLQCDDYHSRFHNSIIPVFLYLGLFNYLNNLKTNA